MKIKGLEFQASLNQRRLSSFAKRNQKTDGLPRQQYLGKSKLKIVEKEIRELNDNEVLIKIGACGVCGSDIHFWVSQMTDMSDIQDTVVRERFLG
jgi:hypothetical protein